jgi:hypothetical protein
MPFVIEMWAEGQKFEAALTALVLLIVENIGTMSSGEIREDVPADRQEIDRYSYAILPKDYLDSSETTATAYTTVLIYDRIKVNVDN